MYLNVLHGRGRCVLPAAGKWQAAKLTRTYRWGHRGKAASTGVRWAEWPPGGRKWSACMGCAPSLAARHQSGQESSALYSSTYRALTTSILGRSRRAEGPEDQVKYSEGPLLAKCPENPVPQFGFLPGTRVTMLSIRSLTSHLVAPERRRGISRASQTWVIINW